MQRKLFKITSNIVYFKGVFRLVYSLVQHFGLILPVYEINSKMNSEINIFKHPHSFLYFTEQFPTTSCGKSLLGFLIT